MAVSDILQNILLKFGADTKGAEKGVKGLGKEAGQVSKSMVQGWADVKAGIDLAIGAYNSISNALKKFEERQRLTMASSRRDVDALRDGARGLISEYDALTTAATLANSEFGVSSDQMQLVGRAALALRGQGNDLKVSLDAITRALNEGNTRALAQFGVEIGKATRGAEGHAEALRIVQELANDTAADISFKGDSLRAAMNDSAAATDALKDAGLGMAAEMGDVVAPIIRGLAEDLARLTRNIQIARAMGDAGVGNIALAIQEAQAFAFDTPEEFEAFLAAGGQTLSGDALRRAVRALQEVDAQQGVGAGAGRGGGGGGGGGGRGRGGGRFDIGGAELPGFTAGGIDVSRALGGTDMFGRGGIDALGGEAPGRLESSRAIDREMEALREMVPLADQAAEAAFRAQQAFIELEVEGSLAFNAVADHGARAFTALASGAMDFGEAMQMALGGILSSIGQEMIADGTRNLLKAAAFAFIPGMQGSAGGLAGVGAAQLAAGMAMVAGGSRIAPSRGAAASAAGVAGTAAAPSRSAAGQQTSHTTIIVGSDFGEMSPSERRARMDRAIMDANGVHRANAGEAA